MPSTLDRPSDRPSLMHVQVIRETAGGKAVTQLYVGVETVSYMDTRKLLIRCHGQTETFVLNLTGIIAVTIEPEAQ